MGFWSKLKRILKIVPGPVGVAAEVVDQVAELVAESPKEVRAVDLVGEYFSPNMICLVPGIYGLTRRGELVERFDGSLDTVQLLCGDKFPPGLASGDKWRRFESEDVRIDL